MRTINPTRRSSVKKSLLWVLGLLPVFAFLVFVWVTTEHYEPVEPAEVQCRSEAPALPKRRSIKVLSWNIQFLAGKNYVFFFEARDGNGQDEAPSPRDLQNTLEEVARVIRAENPDVVLLQEVDVDAKRTGYQDQLALLLQKLAPLYNCSASTYYWRVGFAPHPHIMGRVGMKLATLSKFRISYAQRHALGDFPSDLVTRQFRPKRAILDALIESEDTPPLRILNTHLEAFAQGSDLMQQQVNKVSRLLRLFDAEGIAWLLGGDFNLLTPGRSYSDLNPTQRHLYRPNSEFKEISDHFQVLPSAKDINGPLRELWYTHFPNDPAVKAPDRTIDYIVYSKKLHPQFYQVRSRDTLRISDHLPVIAEFEIH